MNAHNEQTLIDENNRAYDIDTKEPYLCEFCGSHLESDESSGFLFCVNKNCRGEE